MTAYANPWRWNPVRGEYEILTEGIDHGTGEISAIDIFRNSTIFLLGGTGFVGKVLLATLLDGFPELKHLVILVRRNKGVSGEQRFYSDILNTPPLRPIFQKLGEDYLRRRVTIVEGDLSRRFCGLSPSQLSELKGKIDVIVNTAGLVEFDPPLTDSLMTNVYGIRNLVELVQLFETRLVHISTCYVAGKKNGRIPENTPITGYCSRTKDGQQVPFDVKQELGWCEKFISDLTKRDPQSATRESMPRSMRDELQKAGMMRAELWGWMNTYTYTKSMGEQLIASTPGLKYCIVRPAIVESAIRFPFPGWNEGLTTSAPLVLMGGEGVKTWPVRKDGPLEIIPVDLVAAGILIATAATLCGKNKPVYHLATAADNPVMLPRLVAFLGMNSRYKHKHKKTGAKLANLWKTYVETQVVTVEQLQARRARLYRGLSTYHAALNLLKSILGDRFVGPYLRSLRVTRRQVRQQEQTLDKFLPFMIHNTYVFETGNIRETCNMLTDEDRKRLIWDPQNIDWADYWVNIHTKGIETWIRPVFKQQRAAVPLS